MVCDLSSLQEIINDLVVEQLDHTFLNKDIEFFHNCVPTAENIALYISEILKKPIHNLGATLHKIRLQESPNNAAEIYVCLLYTSPSPRDQRGSRMPSSA